LDLLEECPRAPCTTGFIEQGALLRSRVLSGPPDRVNVKVNVNVVVNANVIVKVKKVTVNNIIISKCKYENINM
jgi:hypothetical protein